MADQYIYDMTDTWNNGATTYDAIKINVTDSASAAGSRLLALQIGAVDKFTVSKAGAIVAAAGATFAGALIATTLALSSTLAAVDSLTVTSTDAGAAAAPLVIMDRNSASPLAGDALGAVRWHGRDAGAALHIYADIFASITDPTGGSEDGSLTFRNSVAGVMTTQAVITATGWNSMNIGVTTPGSGAFTTLTASGAVTFTSGSITGITDLAVADGGTGASTAANARTNLGLVIGTNVQAWDADLDTWAAKTAPAGVVVGTTDSQTLTNKTLTGAILNGTLGATTPAAASVTTLAASGIVTLSSYVVRNVATDEMRISGGTLTDGSDGPLLRLFGINRAGLENDIWLQSSTAAVYKYDHSALTHEFLTSGIVRASITATGINSTAIGATTPSTGAFTDLTTTGSVNFNSTGVNTVTITSTDAGASTGPLVILYRDSASAAVSDIIGSFRFNGNDAAGNGTIYCDIYVSIADATNGSEDGTVTFRNIVAGTLTTQAQITATGWNSMNIGATTAGTGRFTTLTATSTTTLATATITTANFGTFSATGATDGIQITSGQIDNSVSENTTGGITGTFQRFYNKSGLTGSISSVFLVTDYNTTSDERKKNFILKDGDTLGRLDPQVAIDIIRKDPVREWDWIDGGGYDVGWGAQTSKKVNDRFATYHANSDTWVMDKAGPRTPYLWAALAGALDKIDALEARLAMMDAA